MKAFYHVSKATKPKHSWVQCVCPPYSYADHTAEDGACEQWLDEAPPYPWSLASPVRWAHGLGSSEPPPAHGAILVDDKTPLDFGFSIFHVGISPSVQVSGKQVMQVQWDTDQSFPKWNWCWNVRVQLSLILVDTGWPVTWLIWTFFFFITSNWGKNSTKLKKSCED